MNRLLRDTAFFTENMVYQPGTNLFAALHELKKIKPFVSLKLCSAQPSSKDEQPALTPASGLAIITYVIAGEATYSDSTGKQGVLKKDGWAWVISGSGILHSIEPATPDYFAVQVCIALSPALENSPPQSAYQLPAQTSTSIPAQATTSQIPSIQKAHDPVQVLMGWHGHKRSEFAAPSLVNYFVVRLNANQQWRYELPLNHAYAWFALLNGEVSVNDNADTNFFTTPSHPVGIYERPIDSINFTAMTDTILVLGSSVEFDYDLVFQKNSVHTSIESLQVGLSGIYNLYNGHSPKKPVRTSTPIAQAQNAKTQLPVALKD